MANLRAATLALLGGMVGTIGVGVAFTGCGGDDTTNPVEDGGADVTTDSAGDVTASEGGDVHAADTGPGADVVTADVHDGAPEADVVTADVHDGAPEADAGRADADAGFIDADAGQLDADAGRVDADAGAFDADSGLADADASDAKVIPPGLLAYPQQYAAAICTGFAGCCGATFDIPKCEQSFQTQGYDNTLPLAAPVFSAGNLTFNAIQAAACEAALRAWPCGPVLTSAENQAILSACHGVLGGTIPVGSPGCISSFECAGGAYCNPAGTCTALAANGSLCTPGESPDDHCSYIGTALPALYCSIYPGDGGGSTSPVGTCAPPQPVDAGSACTDEINFYSDYACGSLVCDLAITGACATGTANPADPTVGFQCQNYVITDAGGE